MYLTEEEKKIVQGVRIGEKKTFKDIEKFPISKGDSNVMVVLYGSDYMESNYNIYRFLEDSGKMLSSDYLDNPNIKLDFDLLKNISYVKKAANIIYGINVDSESNDVKFPLLEIIDEYNDYINNFATHYDIKDMGESGAKNIWKAKFETLIERLSIIYEEEYDEYISKVSDLGVIESYSFASEKEKHELIVAASVYLTMLGKKMMIPKGTIIKEEKGTLDFINDIESNNEKYIKFIDFDDNDNGYGLVFDGRKTVNYFYEPSINNFKKSIAKYFNVDSELEKFVTLWKSANPAFKGLYKDLASYKKDDGIDVVYKGERVFYTYDDIDNFKMVLEEISEDCSFVADKINNLIEKKKVYYKY